MTNTGGIVADECTKNSVSHKKCIGCPANCCSYTCTKQSDVLMHTIYRPNDRSLFNNVNIWMDWSNKPTGHELVYVVTYNWCLIHTYTYAFKSATILCFTFKTYITVTKSLHKHTHTHTHTYTCIYICVYHYWRRKHCRTISLHSYSSYKCLHVSDFCFLHSPCMNTMGTLSDISYSVILPI